MTSYQSKTAPFININGDQVNPDLVQYKYFEPIDYVIQDGSRLNTVFNEMQDPINTFGDPALSLNITDGFVVPTHVNGTDISTGA